MRIAVVMTTDLLPQNRFFELVSLNRGAQIKAFPEETPALEWLFEERRRPPRGADQRAAGPGFRPDPPTG